MQQGELLNQLLSEIKKIAAIDTQARELFEKYNHEREMATKDFDIRQSIDSLMQYLVTVRNRNLINSEQQRLLQQQVVGFFGLSVGSHAALTWSMQIRPQCIKIIDPDTIDASNLNRLRFSLDTVGKPKVEVVQNHIAQISPQTQIISTVNTDLETIKSLFSEHSPLTAVVDSIDDLQGKLWLRMLAKQYQIPLISAADVGDNVILDIERYDKEPKLAYFLGRIAEPEKINFESLTETDKKKLIVQLVGFEQNSTALLESLQAIGKTLATWPQLGATATIAGGVITTTLKKIFLQESVESGRYYISLDDLLTRPSEEQERTKQALIQDLTSKFS